MITTLKEAVEADPEGVGADAFAVTENGRPTLKGRGYRLDGDAIAAADVALALGRPLLVAGEPGCGKTELGFALARRLGISRVLMFSVKSTSDAGELFYTYDALRRFREGQLDGVERPDGRQALVSRDVGEYVDFQALGLAILFAHDREEIAHLLRAKHARLRPKGDPRQRSLVVIDEIDKASRDFPNDLLHEIENLTFKLREFPAQGDDGAAHPLGFALNETPPCERIPPAFRPVVVITSNEERQLPDAFLRRCVFHEIAFPEAGTLEVIVRRGLANRLQRLGELSGASLDAGRIKALVALVARLRDEQMEKKPGIAELLDAAALLALAGEAAPMSVVKPALAKLKNDRRLFDEAAESRAAGHG
jgi:MoxR-like ATPase